MWGARRTVSAALVGAVLICGCGGSSAAADRAQVRHVAKLYAQALASTNFRAMCPLSTGSAKSICRQLPGQKGPYRAFIIKSPPTAIPCALLAACGNKALSRRQPVTRTSVHGDVASAVLDHGTLRLRLKHTARGWLVSSFEY